MYRKTSAGSRNSTISFRTHSACLLHVNLIKGIDHNKVIEKAASFLSKLSKWPLYMICTTNFWLFLRDDLSILMIRMRVPTMTAQRRLLSRFSLGLVVRWRETREAFFSREIVYVNNVFCETLLLSYMSDSSLYFCNVSPWLRYTNTH